MSDAPKDRWDKADVILKPVGGLLTALSVAAVGFFGSRYLDRRQADDTNTRLYAELMSSRESADTALRQQMFNSIISTFLGKEPPSVDPEDKVLALELLAYNFHEAIDLAPLFKHVDAQIDQLLAGGGEPSNAGRDKALAALRDRLSRVAREVTGKQLAALGETGAVREQVVSFPEVDADASGKPLLLDHLLALPGAEEPGEQPHFDLWALDYSKQRREVKVRLAVRPRAAEPEIDAVFWVGFFDFPMIDNTRLRDGRRAAVVLRQWTDDAAVLALAYFPGSRASLKERPFYDEVIEDLTQARAEAASD